MTAYYNEIAPYPAAWIRNLIEGGLVAPGTVDERSISDLTFQDVKYAVQAHFFAGIGVWSHALRLAGWPDDLPVWTGSCPCQPFSAAGRGRGFADERHLWPQWFRLINECRPPIIFGEQVASPAGLGWFDIVQTDLENAGYAVAAADLCAAGVGAPHIRQRLYFVAVSNSQRFNRKRLLLFPGRSQSSGIEVTRSSEVSQLANCNISGLEVVSQQSPRQEFTTTQRGGETGGLWSNADWLHCRDGKSRPVESETFPLVNGSPTRVGSDGAVETQPRAERLKAYGNAICAPLAATFIQAVMEILGTPTQG